MRMPKHLLLVLLCSATVLLRAAEPAPTPLSDTIKITQAVAYVRVTHVTEELRENNVQHTATLTLCGRAVGLAEEKQIEIAWDLPSSDETKPEGQHPKFATGERWIVLLASRNGRWEVLRPLTISPEGKIADERLGAEIGFQPGIDADAAVQLIAAHLEKAERRPTPRATSPSLSGRNQPWKLMRTSPLRRVWPFFPH